MNVDINRSINIDITENEPGEKDEGEGGRGEREKKGDVVIVRILVGFRAGLRICELSFQNVKYSKQYRNAYEPGFMKLGNPVIKAAAISETEPNVAYLMKYSSHCWKLTAFRQ